MKWRYCSRYSFSLFSGVDIGFQLIDVGTHHTVNDVAVLDEDERGHRFDFVLLREIFRLVDIDFDEKNFVFEIIRAPIFDLRRNS